MLLLPLRNQYFLFLQHCIASPWTIALALWTPLETSQINDREPYLWHDQELAVCRILKPQVLAHSVDTVSSMESDVARRWNWSVMWSSVTYPAKCETFDMNKRWQTLAKCHWKEPEYSFNNKQLVQGHFVFILSAQFFFIYVFGSVI